MAITASGFYLLTEEKARIDTLGQSFEAETHKVLLVTDAYTPAFDTHDFRDDVTNEVPATGNYATGGIALTTTDITIGAPAAGQYKLDAADSSWASSTIALAMALIHYYNVGTAATDPLSMLLDFVTAVSTTNGTLLVQYATNGLAYFDVTP